MATEVIEIRRGLQAKPQRGFYDALEDLQTRKTFVVDSSSDRYPPGHDVNTISVT